ncbi:hypothetical protein GQX74_013159 [Glossina fuscipes]|nr:hypothetical protein GQX74_013159 [Glossina fuscipes]
MVVAVVVVAEEKMEEVLPAVGPGTLQRQHTFVADVVTLPFEVVTDVTLRRNTIGNGAKNELKGWQCKRRCQFRERNESRNVEQLQ